MNQEIENRRRAAMACAASIHDLRLHLAQAGQQLLDGKVNADEPVDLTEIVQALGSRLERFAELHGKRDAYAVLHTQPVTTSGRHFTSYHAAAHACAALVERELSRVLVKGADNSVGLKMFDADPVAALLDMFDLATVGAGINNEAERLAERGNVRNRNAEPEGGSVDAPPSGEGQTMRENILVAVKENGPITGEPLSKKAGYSFGGRFKRACADMVKAGAIVNTRGKGYHLPD